MEEEEKMKEKVYWFWISRFEEIGVKTIEKLLNDFKCIEGVYQSTEEELRKLDYLTEEMRERLTSDRSLERLQEEFSKVESRGIHFTTYQDIKFPTKLREIYEAPYYLYFEESCQTAQSLPLQSSEQEIVLPMGAKWHEVMRKN